nr:hypothetical protein [Prevotella sp.]
MKRIALNIIFVVIAVIASAQAKKPTIMVLPADVWCTDNGYVQSFDNQGTIKNIPDYKAALQNNMDLLNVITKIGELMAEKDFPLKDLSATIRNIEQSTAENEMTISSTSGAIISESPIDLLLNRAKADILVELTWKINKLGPKKSVTYTLRGIDAYTNKQVASAQGTGMPSFSAEIPVLLEEAVVANMDGFISQLMHHFEDLQTNGREVAVDLRTFDNGGDINFEKEYEGKELQEIIDDWMSLNTVSHRYSLTDATEDMMTFEQVRIPLYKQNGMAMDTRSFVEQLRKYLKSNYNITSKTLTKGLGKAVLVIGEK